MADALLMKYKHELAISVITQIELAVGATDKNKKKAVNVITDLFPIVALNKAIGERALSLVDLYSTPNRKLFMPDALIAATCLEYNAALLTFNTKDFKFIKGLKLAK